MAISLVQQQHGTQTSGATPLVLTFGVAPTSGNMIVVGMEENDDATGPTIATTNVVYTKQNRFIGDASHDNITLWTGVVSASAGTTVTITPHNTLGNNAAIAGEWSGVQQVLDGTPPTPTDVSSATPSVTSTTPTVSGDLAVAFCGHPDSTGPTATPSGWSALTREGTNASIEGAWLALPDANAVTPQWTFAASKFALLEIVLIKATAGAVFMPRPELRVLQAVNRSNVF